MNSHYLQIVEVYFHPILTLVTNIKGINPEL